MAQTYIKTFVFTPTVIKIKQLDYISLAGGYLRLTANIGGGSEINSSKLDYISLAFHYICKLGMKENIVPNRLFTLKKNTQKGEKQEYIKQETLQVAMEKLQRSKKTGTAEYRDRACRCTLPTSLGNCMQACHRHCDRCCRGVIEDHRHSYWSTYAHRDCLPRRKPLDTCRHRQQGTQQNEAQDFRTAATLRLAALAETPYRRPHKQARR